MLSSFLILFAFAYNAILFQCLTKLCFAFARRLNTLPSPNCSILNIASADRRHARHCHRVSSLICASATLGLSLPQLLSATPCLCISFQHPSLPPLCTAFLRLCRHRRRVSTPMLCITTLCQRHAYLVSAMPLHRSTQLFIAFADLIKTTLRSSFAELCSALAHQYAANAFRFLAHPCRRKSGRRFTPAVRVLAIPLLLQSLPCLNAASRLNALPTHSVTILRQCQAMRFPR